MCLDLTAFNVNCNEPILSEDAGIDNRGRDIDATLANWHEAHDNVILASNASKHMLELPRISI